jgi:hypothetical protein
MRSLIHIQETIHTCSWAADPPGGCATHPRLIMTFPQEGSEDPSGPDQPLGPPSRQTVTGVLICHDRSPHGYKGPTIFWTRQALQECNPPGFFNVVVDKDNTVRKVFMRFASPETFFRFTVINPVWNYNEILLEDTPVCL